MGGLFQRAARTLGAPARRPYTRGLKSQARPQPKRGTKSPRKRNLRAHGEVLVLRRIRYGESSLIVHVLSPEHGKLAILAKGAYRPRSGYCGVLDLFDTLELGWSLAPTSALATLYDGRISRRRRALSTDLGRYRAGLSMLEIAGLGAREAHAEPDLFDLLSAGVGAVQAQKAAPALVCAVFELSFLANQGLSPALEHCAACGQRPPEQRKLATIPFSFALGGRLCHDCAGTSAAAAHLEPLPAATMRVASSLQNIPFSQLERINLSAIQTERLAGFLRRFLEYHLETRPRVASPTSRRP